MTAVEHILWDLAAVVVLSDTIFLIARWLRRRK